MYTHLVFTISKNLLRVCVCVCVLLILVCAGANLISGLNMYVEANISEAIGCFIN